MKRLAFYLPLLAVFMSAGLRAGEYEELVKQGDGWDAKFEAKEALKYYLPAEKLNPDDATLLVKVARQYVYVMDGEKDQDAKAKLGNQALEYAQRAVKASPNMADSHLAVAICWGKMTPWLGNKQKVEASRQIKESSEKATKLDPKNDYAWHMLGRWHQALAEVGGVTRAMASLVYGGLPAASLEESERCLKKAVELNPDRLVHQVELGRTYAQMGRKEEATKYLQKGLSMPNKEKDDPETKERGRYTLTTLK